MPQVVLAIVPGSYTFRPFNDARFHMGVLSTSASRAWWLAWALMLGVSAEARCEDSAVWKFGALVQADHRAVSGDDEDFLWRRIRPSLEGRWGDVVTLRVVPELVGGDVRLTDAYLDVALHPRATLRAGRFKTPLGMERLQSSSALAFNERGLTSELAPSRDIGLQVHGKLADGRLDYALAVLNGAADGREGHSANPDDAYDIAARIVVQPWKASGGALSGLALGLAVNHGDRQGTDATYLPRYRTPGQDTFFRYRTTVMPDGRQVRWSPQVIWHGGPFGVTGEYVASKQTLRDTVAGARMAMDHCAWQLAGRWVLSGEDASQRGVSEPAHPFSPGTGQWGALEAVARVGGLDIDDDAFPVFARADDAASSARSWGMGLNWYLNRYLKLAANYTHARFGHAEGNATGRREDERVFFTRVQLVF